jgi:hypothetical protein
MRIWSRVTSGCAVEVSDANVPAGHVSVPGTRTLAQKDTLEGLRHADNLYGVRPHHGTATVLPQKGHGCLPRGATSVGLTKPTAAATRDTFGAESCVSRTGV